MECSPAFAMLSRGELCLMLGVPNPQAGGRPAYAGGRQQQSVRWNRFTIQVDDLGAKVEGLRNWGVFSQ